MTYWPWWLSGAALAAAALLHWLLTGRLLAVSGAMTALVSRLRWGAPEEPPLDDREILEALRRATAAEFGDSALDGSASADIRAPTRRPPRRELAHVALLGGLVVGGLLSTATAGAWAVTPTLSSDHFRALTGDGPLWGPLTLLAGGALVGFGTRMAGGCTSGHGLCGVSRLQVGSLVATAAFMGAGVAVSLLLGALS